MPKNDVSMSVVRRLPRYLRYLEELEKKGVCKISSKELAESMGLTASQVRQDFNHFGGFGLQGYGYSVSSLKDKIIGILGVNKKTKCILVGAGNLGRALLNIKFDKLGFDLIGVFDVDKEIVGKKVSSFTILDYSDIEEFCLNNNPVLAVITTPSSVVESIATKLAALGIKAFWNFSHFDLSKKFPDLNVENVHLNDSLITLSYLIKESMD